MYLKGRSANTEEAKYLTADCAGWKGQAPLRATVLAAARVMSIWTSGDSGLIAVDQRNA